MRYAALAVCLVLAGCGTTPSPAPQIVTKTVNISVPVYCSPKISNPQYPDLQAALNAAANIFERVKLIMAGRVQRIAHEAELLKALKSCESPQ